MNVYPFVLHLGPLSITGYGLMMMVAFLMAGWTIQLDLRRRGLNEEYAADIVIAAVIGGLIGAKVWYLALAGELLKPATWFQRGGFVWYGGFLGGTLGVLLSGWLKRVPVRFTMQLCAAPLALGYALGRVGCFLVNDDYGIPSSLPWAMKFPRGLPPSTVTELRNMHVSFPANADPFQVVAVHPTQIYETTLMLLAFWWLWRRRDHPHATGWLFAWYLVLAGLERFFVEFIRAKDDRLIGPFTLAQVTSVLMIVLGTYLLQRWREKEAVSFQPSALKAAASS